MYVIVTILKISNVSGHPALYFKMTILRKTTIVHSALMRLDSGWCMRAMYYKYSRFSWEKLYHCLGLVRLGGRLYRGWTVEIFF